MPDYIEMDDLTIDGTINPRANGVDAGYVEELSQWLNESNGTGTPRDLPPIVAYKLPDSTILLSEGFHRVEAYARAGRTLIPVELRSGTREDAILNAAASNQSHGQRRTNEDKRLAVRLTLAIQPQWTDRRVANHVGVGHELVSKMRADAAAKAVVVTTTAENSQTYSGNCTSEADSASPRLANDQQNDENEPDSLIIHGEIEEPVIVERKNTGGAATKRKKEDHAKDAAKAILADQSRTDGDIAEELGCKPAIVTLARKALDEAGRLDDTEQDEPDPIVEFVHSINVVCNSLDRMKAEVLTLRNTPYYRFIHFDSVVGQIEAARKTLWQSRPSEPCHFCKETPREECQACLGTGKMPAYRKPRGAK